MIKKVIVCGEITGTHGIHGEVRVNPWCDSVKFLLQFKQFFLDENGSKSLFVASSRLANTVALVKFQGITTVEEATKLKKTVLYINRDDADIGDGYFIQELIGCEIHDADSNELLGTVTDVTNAPANDVWHITNSRGEFLVPAIKDVIVKVDVSAGVGYIKPLKGIFDNED